MFNDGWKDAFWVRITADDSRTCDEYGCGLPAVWAKKNPSGSFGRCLCQQHKDEATAQEQEPV